MPSPDPDAPDLFWRWRVQCVVGQLVLAEASGPGEADFGCLVFAGRAEEYERKPGVRVELQEKRGHGKYHRVLLAVANRVVPPDGRKAEGRWAVYAGPVAAAVEKGLVRW